MSDEPTSAMPLLTVDQVAARLAVGKATVYAMLAARRIGFYVVGTGVRGSRRCSEEQVAAYLETQKQAPVSETQSVPRNRSAGKLKHLS